MLTLALLGSPSITLDGKPVTGFASKKVVLLVCYLVLEGDRSHIRETLTCLLWGEKPDRSARASLSQALYNMQKLLPGHFIVTTTTVAFDITRPHQLDMGIFCETIEQPEANIAQMEKAIALYRGDFLEGYPVDYSPELGEWLNRKREHYQVMLLSGMEKLAACYVARGQWKPAADLDRRILAIEPWHEEAHRQLMLCLARQGEYNDALAHYQICCQVLDKELGVTPSADTVALHERIWKARAARRHNLPLASGVFVGRQAELEHLALRMRDADCRLITLVGPGGVGKTRLAQELIRRHMHEFLSGAYLVSLVSITRPELIVPAIADVTGIEISGPAPLREQLIEQIGGQELLLVLDSFEHLVNGSDLIVDILKGAPEVKIIVTSRVKLDLRDEWVFTLDGLPVPPEGIDAVEQLQHYDAVEHFVNSAKRQQVGFVLLGQQVNVGRLCRILGGSPLGIELAAGLLPAVSCVQIVVELERNLDVLSTTRRDVPERHRSLRAVFDHSWQLLAVDEQRIFSCLSIFRGGFTLEAATEVAGADMHMLNRLVSQSLLYILVDEDGATSRYEIHETLRQYAEEMLRACLAPETQRQIEEAHIAYYVDFLVWQWKRWQDGDQQAAIAAISRDLGNIRMAWHGAAARGDVGAIDIAMNPLHRFYDMRGWYQEGKDLLSLALEGVHDQESPDAQHAYGHLSARLAWSHLHLGQMAEAELLARQGVEVLRQHDEGKLLAFALNTLGAIQNNVGRYGSARENFQESLAIYRRLGYQRECYAPLVNLGFACNRVGDYETAKQVLGEGITLCYEEEIRDGVVYFLVNLADLHCVMRDLTTAKRYYEQALPICEELGLQQVKAGILISLSKIYVYQTAFEQALEVSQEGIAILCQTDHPQTRAGGLVWQGLAHHGLGDELPARRCIIEGLKIALKIQVVPSMLLLLMGGAVLLSDGEHPAKGIELLMLVAQHPLAEEGDRVYALELLAERGVTFPDDRSFEQDRPVAEVASILLAELQMPTSPSIIYGEDNAESRMDQQDNT
ncbi:MAG: tetratricopeptide repeat protein [Anaerolineae bacterium]|nr:tetratricopeptide repeat protein [Anaerolineae bacterium]